MIGGTCIVQPSGEVVARASSVGDELIAFDCDLDLARMGRETIFNFARHRRIEHYGVITARAGAVSPPE